MTPMLYWTVYHLELGRLDPKVLDLAIKRWVKRAMRLASSRECADSP